MNFSIRKVAPKTYRSHTYGFKYVNFILFHIFSLKKVQVGKDQEKVQSEKNRNPKTKVGKNQTNTQVLIP